jgi:hypothetical protein
MKAERFMGGACHGLWAGKVGFLTPGLKIVQVVADGFGAVVDGGAAYFGKVEAGVEGVRYRLGRIEIDFADYASEAGRFSALKKIGVESTGIAFAAGCGGSDYAIDVNEIGVVFVAVIFLGVLSKKPRNHRKLTCS